MANIFKPAEVRKPSLKELLPLKQEELMKMAPALYK
jgi:hypothetical protein